MDKLIATTEQEFTILQYHEVDRKIKALEIERSTIKEVITKEYFSSYEIMINTQGILLATYKSVPIKSFDSKRFEKDFPDTYMKYIRETVSKRLLVK